MLQFGHCTATILRLISPCGSYLSVADGPGHPSDKADHSRGGDASIWPLPSQDSMRSRAGTFWGLRSYISSPLCGWALLRPRRSAMGGIRNPYLYGL